jgi:hypothetical protein
MEQLLAQALSSRQRELEQLTMNTTKDNSKNAEEWITGSNDPVANALNASIAIKRSHDIKRPTEQNSIISKKNVSFNEENNEEILYDKGSISNTSNDTMTSGDALNDNSNDNGNSNGNHNDKFSFLSKLKIKSPNSGSRNESSLDSIPLDDFMTDYDDDGQSEDNNVQLFVNDTTRDTRDAREYVKLEKRINKIQTCVESIKETQDKILELLQSK